MSHVLFAQANALDIPLLDRSAHVVCTSPPYYQARRYEGQQDTEWHMVYSPGSTSEYQLHSNTQLHLGWTGPLGWEPTPALFVAHLVLIFREVRRVLRDDGVCWIVMGDKYVGSGESTGETKGQLLPISHQLAQALQADGWLLRNVLVWHKLAPMPESVGGWQWSRSKCRCTISPRATDGKRFTAYGRPQSEKAPGLPDPNCPVCHGTGIKPNSKLKLTRGSWRHTRAHEYVLMLTKSMGYFSDQTRIWEPVIHKGASSRPNKNPHSVLAPRPYFWKGSHVAPFNPDLIGPLIRATCPARACSVCGAPWAPIVEAGRRQGYKPTCDCEAVARPGLVLDPFAGSCTAGLVCKELGLRFVGLDLSMSYLREEGLPRVLRRTPAEALDNLPLFSLDEPGGKL